MPIWGIREFLQQNHELCLSCARRIPKTFFWYVCLNWMDVIAYRQLLRCQFFQPVMT